SSLGSPPSEGTMYTRVSGIPGLLQLIASHFPSGDKPWLPVHLLVSPVLIGEAVPPSTGMVHSCPLRLKISFLPSLVQFGASIRPGPVETTMARRKLSSIPIVCNVL